MGTRLRGLEADREDRLGMASVGAGQVAEGAARNVRQEGLLRGRYGLWVGLGGGASLVGLTAWFGLAGEAAADWAGTALLVCWIALLAGMVWKLLYPAPFLWKLLCWLLFSGLLLGMVLPADWLRVLQEWAAGWLGLLPGVASGGTAPALVHVLLYSAFAASLLWARGDLRPLWALAPLAGLAVATELMQILVPGRHADPVDVVFNWIGIAMATGAWWLVQMGLARRVQAG